MKEMFVLFLLSYTFLTALGQRIQTIANTPLDVAITDIESIIGNKITDKVKLVGIGDVALFAKESKIVNTTLCAYLVSQRGFRHIVVEDDAWKLRQLNDYLTDATALDTILVDSLMRACFTDNHYLTDEFKSFVCWLKNYNLLHQNDRVSLFGIDVQTIIPPSYFLAAYIFPVDEEHGRKLVKKWGKRSHPDSLAFQEIAAWVKSVENSGFPVKDNDLIANCKQDLAHNNAVMKRTSFDQQFSQKVINNYQTYTANQVLRKLYHKTILYTSNHSVIKGDLSLPSVIDGQPVASLGKIFHDHLKKDYFACVTDFSECANLLKIDLEALEVVPFELKGSEYVTKLSAKKDHYFLSADRRAMKQYVPHIVSPIKKREATFIPDKGVPCADALLIFSNLTVASLFVDK